MAKRRTDEPEKWDTESGHIVRRDPRGRFWVVDIKTGKRWKRMPRFPKFPIEPGWDMLPPLMWLTALGLGFVHLQWPGLLWFLGL